MPVITTINLDAFAFHVNGKLFGMIYGVNIVRRSQTNGI